VTAAAAAGKGKKVDNMNLRRLEPDEHGKTRSLWEAVFQEDMKAFLDYYYNVKAKDNKIYVIENEEHEICSMLQLNPYMIQMGDQDFTGNYIIAVATRADCRKQGLMRELLHASLRNMYDRGEIFTFLMPAAEAIYRPFDFRFVYRQRQGMVTGKCYSSDLYVVREAEKGDCRAMAKLARQKLRPYQIYIKRDAAYYSVMLKEQASEQGGVKLVYVNDTLVGFFAYTGESGYMIREPLFLAGYEKAFLQAVYQLTGDEEAAVKCYGIEDMDADKVEYKPNIMFRILHPETVFAAIRVKGPLNVALNIIDPIIAENNRCLHLTAADGEYIKVVKEAGDPEADTITIAALAGLLFGYHSAGDIMAEKEVNLSPETVKQLERMDPLAKIFLNEVV